jgi:hypothetical protein
MEYPNPETRLTNNKEIPIYISIGGELNSVDVSNR